MILALVLVVLVALTVATLLVSRLGARVHQEDLNSPMADTGPTRDRPGDAGAEAMGVESPGQPTPRDK